jgi:hypothetical protein
MPHDRLMTGGLRVRFSAGQGKESLAFHFAVEARGPDITEWAQAPSKFQGYDVPLVPMTDWRQ